MHYILTEEKEIVESDPMEWASWLENGNRRIGLDRLNTCTISTVFLGLEHGHDEGGRPLLFETLVDFSDGEEEMYRCATYKEAERQHLKAVVSAIENELS